MRLKINEYSPSVNLGITIFMVATLLSIAAAFFKTSSTPMPFVLLLLCGLMISAATVGVICGVSQIWDMIPTVKDTEQPTIKVNSATSANPTPIITALIINGVARSGKDTFIELLRRQPNTHVVAISSIDPVKFIASKFEWKGEKTNKDRLMLSNLKDMLTEYNDFPFKTATNYLAETFHITEMPVGTKHLFYCVQSREPEDIEKYKGYFNQNQINTKTVLIKRQEAQLKTPNNHADQGVFKYAYDLCLNNNKNIKKFEKEIVRTLFNTK